MNTRARYFCFASILAVVLLLTAPWAKTCGPWLVFREYLHASFWKPMAKYLNEYVEPKRNKSQYIYAGMAEAKTDSAIDAVRTAYRDIAAPPNSQFHSIERTPATYENLRKLIARALQSSLSPSDRDELHLIDCKVDMREGEDRDRQMLVRAREKLLRFVQTAQTPAFVAEAKGWIARVHYLLGDKAAAAKIYLDELDARNEALAVNVLINSLRIIFPYNGSDAHLADHLEEYFDTPKHALFVVNIVTNPAYYRFRSEDTPAQNKDIGRKVLASLDKHQELFKSGQESDALALASMRAALFTGSPERAIQYARALRRNSERRRSAEFNWMLGAAYFLTRNYGAAEAPLLRIFKADKAPSREQVAAAQALVGVYQKLNRPVEQLWAAFGTYTDITIESEADFLNTGLVVAWPYFGSSLDIPYLLDVELTDTQLNEYLRRYGEVTHPKFWTSGWYPKPRHRGPSELVQYALAVRHARREEYGRAAKIYEQLNARPRAARMRQLEPLFTATRDPHLPRALQLEAKFRYAAFIADHSTQIFFNDTLWHGYQRNVFMEQRWNEAKGDSMTASERRYFLRLDRRLRDEQEEYWRAYQILDRLRLDAGPTSLGKRAAQKALDCLVRINTGRFGREKEISSAQGRIVRWLKSAG